MIIRTQKGLKVGYSGEVSFSEGLQGPLVLFGLPGPI